MGNARIEKRLREVSGQLKKLRTDLAVADEQVAHFADIADDTRLRSLVSETPLSDRDHRHAQRHADRMAAERDSLRRRITELEATQDDLLDRLTGSV